ncbi:MAG: hydroxymethylbilane synthase [Planctomycetaceae bacterium]|nr:hydroxymethylbilane synthase [Planctomycetaceae bacterium]
MWQAQHVAGLITAAVPETNVEIVEVTTSGDSNPSDALRSFGGLGVFTREVQRAVLDGRADLAVHSLKDLPTASAPGLCLAAVPQRDETADALVLPAGHVDRADLSSLPAGTRIGTGSLRRRSQLLFLRPDLVLEEVRGNVATRLKKLDDGDFDALILAVAGLKRLGLEARISRRLNPPEMYAAVGQGALGIECREGESDLFVRELLSKIEDPGTRARITAERALLARLQAGCHAPVGSATRVDGDQLFLEAVVLSPDGSRRLVVEGNAPVADAVRLGVEVAERLLQRGAQSLMDS